LNINEDWYAEQKLLLADVERVYVKKGNERRGRTGDRRRSLEEKLHN